MTRKIIAGIAGCVLLAAIALFAAEKAQGKKPAAKPKQQATAVEKQPKQQQKGLLDQLIVAYKANDTEKMGAIIKKMETRRDKTQKLAKLNKWHQGVHRRWAMAGVGGGRGQQMAGPGWGRGGQMPRGGPACPERTCPERSRRSRGACQRPCCGQGAMAGWGPQAGAGMQRPMNTWRQQPAGFGAMQGMGQGPQHIAPQTWNMPRGGERQTRVPPADWGW
jgi:hypothetical protein